MWRERVIKVIWTGIQLQHASGLEVFRWKWGGFILYKELNGKSRKSWKSWKSWKSGSQSEGWMRKNWMSLTIKKTAWNLPHSAASPKSKLVWQHFFLLVFHYMNLRWETVMRQTIQTGSQKHSTNVNIFWGFSRFRVSWISYSRLRLVKMLILD